MSDAQSLGAVYVAVVPSLAGASEAITKGGQTAAQQFGQAFNAAHNPNQMFSRVDFNAVGRQHGEKYVGGYAEEMERGTSRISKAFSATSAAAGAMGGATVLAATAAAESVKKAFESFEGVFDKFFEIGEQAEKVERTLRIHTTAMGEDLEALQSTVYSVAGQTSASFDTIASATAKFAQKTGLTGQALKDIVTDFVDSQQLLGQSFDVGKFVGASKALGVSVNDLDGFLTKLFNISRASDISLSTLIDNLAKGAVTFREMGISAESAAALISKFGARFDGGAVLTGLRRAAKEATAEHKDLNQFLTETIAKMEHYRDVGNTLAESKIAQRVFGAKGALVWKAAVDQGIISVEALGAALNVPNERISELYGKTRTFSDYMTEFRHKAEGALAPIGIALVKSIGGALEHVSDWLSVNGDKLIGWVEDFALAGVQAGKYLTTSLGSVVEALGHIEKGFGWLVGDEGLKAAGQAAVDMGRKMESSGPMFDGLSDNIRKVGEDAKQTVAISELLGASLKKTSDGGLVLKDNSPETMERLKRLHEYGVDVFAGPDGKIHVSASTEEARKKVEEVLKGLTGKTVTIQVIPKFQASQPGQGSIGQGWNDGMVGPGTMAQPPAGGGSLGQAWSDDIIGPGTGTPMRKWSPGPGKPSLYWDPALGWVDAHGNPPGGKRPSHIGPTKPLLPAIPRPEEPLTTPQAPAPKRVPLPLPNGAEMPWWINPFLWSATGGHDQGGPVAGAVRRPGPTDTIPAWLAPKEFVVRAGQAQKYAGILDAINNGIAGFDEGGPVGGWSIPGLPGLFGGHDDDGQPSKKQRQQEAWDESQVSAARSVERAKDRVEDLQASVEEYNTTISDLTEQYQDAEGDEVEQKKIAKQLAKARQGLARAERDLTESREDEQTAERKQQQAARAPVGGDKEKTGHDDGALGFGQAFVQGIAQGLGFGDVFKSFTGGSAKPPWAFGIAKIIAGMLGIAVGGSGDGDDSSGGSYGSNVHHGTGALPGPARSPGPGNAGTAPAAPGPAGTPTGTFRPAGAATSGGRAGTAAYIYQAAVARGYSHDDATAIVAYSIGESGLNPGISGGVQGDDEVIGLFQEKAGFARGGGVDPSQRGTVEGNVTAYLNQLGQHRGQGDIMDQLLATSVGGPMYTGGRAYMSQLIGQATQILGPQPGAYAGVPDAVTAAAGFGGGGGYGVNPATQASSLRLSGSTTNAFRAAVRSGAETNGPLYTPGLNTGGYGNSAGLPPWAVEMGAKFGLVPSTYPDGGTLHELGYAMDFAPRPDNPDGPGSMDRFSQMIADRLTPQTLELIHSGSNGKKYGIAGGRPVGPGTDMPGYFADDWSGHAGHVHVAFDTPPVSDAMGSSYGAVPQQVSMPSFGGGGGGASGYGGYASLLHGLLTNLPRTLADLTSPFNSSLSSLTASNRTASAMTPASTPDPQPQRSTTGPAVQINQNMSGIMGLKDVHQTVNQAMLTGSRFTNSAVPAGLSV